MSQNQPEPTPFGPQGTPTNEPKRRPKLLTAAMIFVFGTLGAIAMAVPIVAGAAVDAAEGAERGPHHACWEDLIDAAETEEEELDAFETALEDCGIHAFGRTWRITSD